MDTQSPFKINLDQVEDAGLTRSWHLDDYFFAGLDEQEIQHGDLQATLRVTRAQGAYDFHFLAEGQVELTCDRCLEPMIQPITAEATIRVRRGMNYEDNGDLITVPQELPEVDVAWNLYETIALAIPISHVHPAGQCSAEMEQLLGQHEPTTDSAGTDDRWSALRDLIKQ